MLHFFRKIRRDLLANSKFFKYLKYAIGEIVLVVLGILIALYINNQNEKSKNSELFDQILVEVETELIHNIDLTKGSIDYLHSFDSAYSLVLFDKLSPENFENDTLFSFRNLPWVTNDIQKESFEKLNTIDGGINAKQDSLYASLKYLYVSDRFKYGQELEKYSLDLHLKILESREEFSWYVNTLLGQPYTQDEISYYIDNPLYRNHIATVSKLTLSQFKVHLTAWEQILLSNYKRVYDYLEEENV